MSGDAATTARLYLRLFRFRQKPGDPCPLVAKKRRPAHFVVELGWREIVCPAAAIAEFDEMRLPTLRQGEPFARDTVVRAGLPCRHGKARSARGIGASAYSRAYLIRAMKILLLFAWADY